MTIVDVRIVTADVARLVRFYEDVTGIAATRLDAEYAEIRTPDAVIAISSHRKVEMRSPGATTPSANRSAIVDFRVDGVVRERARLDAIVPSFVRGSRTRRAAPARSSGTGDDHLG